MKNTIDIRKSVLFCLVGVMFLALESMGQDVTYRQGSTRKIEQLVGDFDRSTDVRDSTSNKTFKRFGVPNTDLGVPFEHNGKTFVAFGDILFGDGDPLGFTMDTDASDGVDLEFVSNAPGTSIPITIPGVDLGGFGVPLDGISWNNAMYLYASERGMAKSVLAKSIDDGRSFTKLYDVSDYKFINISVEKMVSTADFPEPVGTDIQVMFGSGAYRRSSVFLAYQTAASIESNNIKYYAGYQNGQPIWVDEESKAIPIFDQPCVGELSVVYNAFLEKWVATYNCPSFTGKNGENFERGVNVRTSDNPWGSWSDPFLIYTPAGNEGILGYCQMMHRDWNQSTCDTIQDPGRDYEFGGTYGPYQFNNLATGSVGSETTIYYTLSLWNPYTVILMESTLQKSGSSPAMMETPVISDVVPTIQAPLSNGIYTIGSQQRGFLDNSIILGFKDNSTTVAIESGYDAQKWQLTLLSDNHYSIINVSSGQALTVENNDSDNQTDIVVQAYEGNDNQRWQIHPVTNGFRIISKSSGKSLQLEDDFKFNDTGGETRTDPKPRLIGNVIQNTYRENEQFIWVFEATTSVDLTDIAIGGSNFLYNLDVEEIQTAQVSSITPGNATAVLPYWTSSNLNVLTIDSISGRMVGISPGNAIITLTSGNIQDSRNVTVTNLPSVSTPLTGGFYTITTAFTSGQRIDDGFNAYGDANPNIILENPTNDFDQVWEFVQGEDGYYTIFKSTTRDSVMAIANGVIKPLGNLELAPYDSLNDNPHQRWQIVPEGTSFRIISKFSGLSLEAQQSPSGPIANVRQAYWSSFLRHEWIIEETDGPDFEVLSVNLPDKLKMTLYPNPAKTYFNVVIDTDLSVNEVAVDIIDLQGKIILTRSVSNGRVDLDNRIKPGFYQVIVRSDIGEYLSKHKLVIGR
ncbi:MAG: DUF4185 domain-containing protein [Bacteroidota bacterium]